MTANKPMTGEQLDELMTVAVNMQRDAETDCNRPSAMFAYAVQVAVLELRKVRNDVAALAAENAGLKSANGIALKILNDEETMVTSLWASSVQEVEVKTPSTDAFLAEVRASSITDALKSLDGVFDTDCVMESNGISYEDAEQRTAGAYAVSKALDEFAAQLRKGVQS
ncbi:hypothetical protein RVW73_002475 [Enterobacter asburiae]|nr:hypothetical protein [Enterobacter asburiae]